MVQPNYNNPPAYMGFVGFVKVKGNQIVSTSGVTNFQDFIVRATTADINLSQEITKPDVIDSRYDKTIYQLGPKLVDGSIEFPAIYDVPGTNTVGIFEILYRLAVTRQSAGLLSDFDIEVKYATTAPGMTSEFLFERCIVNTWQFSVAQSDVVSCTFDIIGLERNPSGILPIPTKKGPCTPSGTWDDAADMGSTRIVTWNDARVQIGFTGGGGVATIAGESIRTFEANINNDAERFYTLNKFLFPQAIAPRKRDIDGSFTFMGRLDAVSSLANSNEERCREENFIDFGYVSSGGDTCASGVAATFSTTVPNVVFQIEEMSLTNDLFETTVNWLALPGAGTGVCDPLLDSIGVATFI